MLHVLNPKDRVRFAYRLVEEFHGPFEKDVAAGQVDRAIQVEMNAAHKSRNLVRA